MLIERNIARFLVFSEDSILDALSKISANKSGFVLPISEQGHIVGTLTDGDVRRWLMNASEIDLETPVSKVANTSFISAALDSPPETIAGMFSSRIRSVPLVDSYKRVVAIAFPDRPDMTIGRKTIGAGNPCYIIAEVGNNHNGDVELAKALVDLALDAGADCVKFQMREMSALYTRGGQADDASQDLGAQYTLDLLARFNLRPDLLFQVFDYARSRGIEPLCTPWDLPSFRALREYGIAAYKVASADLTNHELLHALIEVGRPLVCSTGMASEAEIKESVALLRSSGTPFCLMHTNSTYPTPFKDINLRYMDRLAEIGSCPVGYSGHERGWSVPVAAVARGACIIEKHFTVDRGMEGNDHKVSLLPHEFAEMVKAIRAVEDSMGAGGERVVTQGEMMNREVLAKSLHAAEAVAEGEVITEAMIVVRSPGQGLQPNRQAELIGRRANRPVAAGTPFFPSDLEDVALKPRPFNFSRPWGVPVRWHDYKHMLGATNLTFLEYHLSYKDMEVDLADWFDVPLPIAFAVHAPELFKGDHILDLASEDADYRARSIQELQRVVDVTRALKRYHPQTSRPMIITNMGGFTTAHAVPPFKRASLYESVRQALMQIDADGVEIIAQTMPPFPWHFGGQSFHNLFMDPEEIVDFCGSHGLRVCLDVSHSQLACNHFGWSMKEFCEKVAPYSAHLHIVDAKGVDGEGLQIGDGDVDFGMVGEVLNKACPQASFIPEIWQGHKDSGSGFWIALDRLEQWFGERSARLERN